MRKNLTERMSKPGIRLRGIAQMPLGSKLALAIIAIMVLVAVFAPLLAPHDPLAIELSKQPPSSEFLLGTDDKGRDVLSRLMYGARYSLVIGLAATAFALVMGAIFGSIAAVSRRWVSELIMRVMDVIMSFPGIALAAVFVAVFGASLPVIIFAIGFLYIPQLTRVVRANVMAEYGEDYVRAVIVSGAKAPWILIKHVARNSLAPVMVFATVLVADAIVFEASLSFIQAGIPEPTPTWGNVIASARDGVLYGLWWQALYPGLAIMITVLALNILSEGLTDAMVASPTHAAPPAVTSGSDAQREADRLVADPVAAHKLQA